MNEPSNFAVQHLKKEEAALMLRLNNVRTAISALQELPDLVEKHRHKGRLEILREILRLHPEGVAVSSIPNLLKAQGHVSYAKSDNTNWLCPSQLRPEDRFFTREKGWIKPKPEFLQSTGPFEPQSFPDTGEFASRTIARKAPKDIENENS